MSPKFIHNLSGDEIQKECIRFGLSGRFTMKEALVELTTILVKTNLDPKTYQFFPSQPLQGYFPYQVVIITKLVETMKTLPASMGPSTSSSMSAAALSSPTSPVAGVTTANASSRAPLCSNVPFFSPNYPPPTAPLSSGVDAGQVFDDQVLKKLLNSVEKIQTLLEKTLAVIITVKFRV